MSSPIFRHLSVASDSGSGRPYILLYERDHTGTLPHSLAQALQAKTRVLSIKTERITDETWEAFVSEFISLLAFSNVRQASFVTFGACGALVQALALKDLKLVRTVVFVDASTRAHPTRFSRTVDRVERTLPLGLPLRLRTKGFDAKPFLQRIRCPALVVTTSDATAYQKSEAEVLEAGLPTAWRVSVAASDATEKLAELVHEFQEVPAKCPRKTKAS